MTSPSPTSHTLSATDLEELSRQITGTILTAEDPGFGAVCAGFNRASSRQPAVAVQVTSSSDVAATVRFAGEHDLPVAIIGSGHHATRPMVGGVLIVTADLNAIAIDAASRLATVGAGARWGEVVQAAARHGLAPLAGSSPTVGVAGYILGGGISPTLGRVHGWASGMLSPWRS